MQCLAEARWLSGVAIAVTCAMGCGGESSSSSEEDGGATSKGGTTSTGGTSGGGTSTGGTSTGGTSSGSGGSSGSVDCTGDFGAPRVVLEMPNTSLSSLTLRPDELELVYSAGLTAADSPQNFFRARRASKADVFSEPVALPELDAACTSPDQTRSGDLSPDGLRLYFTCYDSGNPSVTPLYVARRASFDAPFEVDPTPIGNVNGGPSVTTDELELFASLSNAPAMHYWRNDTSEPFSNEEPIAGLENFVLLTPEIAPNDLDIFVSQTTSGSAYGLVTAARSGPGAAFGVPRVVLPETMNEIFGSAAVSNDCRSVYFVHAFAMEVTYRVEEMSR